MTSSLYTASALKYEECYIQGPITMVKNGYSENMAKLPIAQSNKWYFTHFRDFSPGQLSLLESVQPEVDCLKKENDSLLKSLKRDCCVLLGRRSEAEQLPEEQRQI